MQQNNMKKPLLFLPLLFLTFFCRLNPLNETASEGKQHAEQVAGKPLEDEEEDEEQPPQNDDAADDW